MFVFRFSFVISDVLKSFDGFFFKYSIWIAVQTVLVCLICSSSIAVITTTSSNFNKEDLRLVTEVDARDLLTSFNRSTTAAPAVTDSQLQTLDLNYGNTSNADTSDHGGILGTAAAYKLDVREPLIGCSLSEFSCKNGRCIPITKYCDKISDCDDNSDEPRFCTRKLFKIT